MSLADRLSKAKDLLIGDEPFAELPDVIGYQDIVHQWDRGYRATLERLIRSGDTGPRGAQIHDFPKNETAVRPLAHFDPRDRIIYEAMVYRIAPRIDRQLHPYVYGYKWWHRMARPVPWSACWGRMKESTRKTLRLNPALRIAHTDVSAFYEHIDIGSLVESLYDLDGDESPGEDLAAFLNRFQSITDARGLPQGPNASGILANLVLMPIDAFLARASLPFARYSDDIRIFHRDRTALRDVLIEITRLLRGMGLTIAAAKTRILDPEEGLAEELDTRYSSLKYAVKNGIPGSRDKIREEFESLDKEGTFSGTKTRFVLNRMSELGDDYAVSWCLESLERTPHAVTEVFRYLAVTGRSREREITGRLARFIDRGASASFPFTEQRILRYFLSTQDSPAKTKEAAWMVLEDRNRQDYSREVAARCAGRHASLAESRILRNRFEREQIPAVRRALLVGLYESGHLTSDYLSEVKDAYAHLLWTCTFLATEPNIALPKIG
ncbi:RNA-directed DNA polymerase [Streptomyces sp. NPDC018947]|uniref:RNA-directed DNA polymerase n=1 Tax=Streptomyces sp. NPDC018947 TaxID=3365054 RepID=UPI0037AB264F